MARKTNADELIWAKEVLEVYQNLGSMPNSRDWSSVSARHLFDWASCPENEGKFLTTMVPKATDLKSKLSPEDVTEAVLNIDTKTIQELQRHLQLAIEASAKPPKPREAEPTLDDILG